MAHRIELNQLGAGGAVVLAAVVGGFMYLAPGSVKFSTDIGGVGNTYSAWVQCEKGKKEKPSLWKGFMGVHQGERVLVRSITRRGAQAAIEKKYKGCDVSIVTREGRRKRWL